MMLPLFIWPMMPPVSTPFTVALLKQLITVPPQPRPAIPAVQLPPTTVPLSTPRFFTVPLSFPTRPTAFPPGRLMFRFLMTWPSPSRVPAKAMLSLPIGVNSTDSRLISAVRR